MLLWPAQVIGVIEINVGRPIAILLAACANVALYGAIGILVGILGSSVIRLFLLYVAASFLCFAHAYWDAGYDLTFVSGRALFITLVIDALPFVAVGRLWSKAH